MTLWALAALLLTRFLLAAVASSSRHTSGFVAYYTSARLVREGSGAARFYDDRWFEAQVARQTPDVGDIYNVNPPAASLMLWPLAGLSYTEARTVWTGFNLLVLGVTARVLLRHLGISGAALAAALAVLMLWQPLLRNFALGQAYVVLLGLLTLAWYAYRHRRDALLGSALALALVLKAAGVSIWLLLLWQRRWRALGWAVSVSVLLVAASAALVGADAWVAYFGALRRLVAAPALAVVPYQTLLSLFRHLFSYDPQWNPTPIRSMPHLAAALPPIVALLLLGFSWHRASRRDPDALAFAAFAVLGIAISPLSLDYHYTLALLPLAIGASWCIHFRRDVRSAAWLTIAAALIALPLPYWDRRLETGALALLAYPKLYGALLLWGFLIAAQAGHRARETRNKVTSPRRPTSTRPGPSRSQP
jgi:hypothetical protein